jgi:hypothetical protein
MRFLAGLLFLAACTGTPGPDGPTAGPDGAASPAEPPAADPAEPVADSVQAITGVVRHFDLEGGFFAIRGDDGVTYDPSNLAEEFRQDGLRVRARVRLRPDMGGIHMVGPIVDIIEIERDLTGG